MKHLCISVLSVAMLKSLCSFRIITQWINFNKPSSTEKKCKKRTFMPRLINRRTREQRKSGLSSTVKARSGTTLLGHPKFCWRPHIPCSYFYQPRCVFAHLVRPTSTELYLALCAMLLLTSAMLIIYVSLISSLSALSLGGLEALWCPLHLSVAPPSSLSQASWTAFSAAVLTMPKLLY